MTNESANILVSFSSHVLLLLVISAFVFLSYSSLLNKSKERKYDEVRMETEGNSENKKSRATVT